MDFRKIDPLESQENSIPRLLFSNFSILLLTAEKKSMYEATYIYSKSYNVIELYNSCTAIYLYITSWDRGGITPT